MDQAKNEQLADEFASALTWCDEMFDMLADTKSMYQRPIPLRHQIIFYYGHLPAFAWNKIFGLTLKRNSLNPQFDELFERGIDPSDLSAPPEVGIEWPDLSDIADYKKRVEHNLHSLLAAVDVSAQENRSLWQATNVVLEHYLMHVETFLYMLHQLPHEMKRCARPSAELSLDALHTQKLISIPKGWASLGIEDSASWGWCNESGGAKVFVPAFGIQKYPVTNAEFMEFVQAGGYDKRELWTENGWRWVRRDNRRYPDFWRKDGNKWFYRDQFELIDLPLNFPAWVTYAEAQAFAKWRGWRLPSEAEFHRAAYATADGERLFPWGDELDGDRGNFGLKRLGPVPVGSYPQGASFFGVEELVGNGWEWTSSIFSPFEGFQPIPSYPGYSAEFFDGNHYVLKGASPVTADRLVRRSFRNWFQPHYPYVYAKFRCVDGGARS